MKNKTLFKSTLFDAVIANNIDRFNNLVTASNITQKDNLGRNPLMIAVIKGRKEIIDEIMSYQLLDINDRDYRGNNALMMAVRKNNLDIVKQVIRHIIDTYSPIKGLMSIGIHGEECSSSVTALMEASLRGYIEVVKILVEASSSSCAVLATECNPNEVDIDGNNALMLAAKYGRQDVVSYLKSFTYDINMKNKFGDTALMLGVRTNSIEVVSTLVSLGASMDIKSNKGYTALGLADQYGRTDIALYLSEKDNVETIGDSLESEGLS